MVGGVLSILSNDVITIRAGRGAADMVIERIKGWVWFVEFDVTVLYLLNCFKLLSNSRIFSLC